MKSYVIVGSGISGIASAVELLNIDANRRVVVVEKNATIGGRVKSAKFGASEVSLGAEFLHGSKDNIVLEYAKEHMDVTRVISMRWPQLVHVRGKGVFDADHLASFDEIQHAEELIDQIEAEFDGDSDGETLCDIHHVPQQRFRDYSIGDFLTRLNVTKESLGYQFLDATVANDFCTTLDQLGARELMRERRTWANGEDYVFLRDSNNKAIQMHDIFCALAQEARDRGVQFRLNMAVKRIEKTDDDKVVLTFGDGEQESFDACIVAADLRSLCEIDVNTGSNSNREFKQDIRQFYEEAQGNAAKVLLQFSERFFPANVWNLLCLPGDDVDSPVVPEFWQSHADPCVIVAFLTSHRVHSVLHDDDSIELVLRQLAEALYGAYQFLKSQDTPSFLHMDESLHENNDVCLECTRDELLQRLRDSLVAHRVHKWPYSYSHAVPNGAEARARLLRTQHKNLMFCGEACRTNSALQGAMQSGITAAHELH
ncbi:MAG: hypothetical protein MHM6MM_002409 [Cercozoa sp. M6MM]